MARYVANEVSIIEDALAKVNMIAQAYNPSDSMDEDAILIAAYRAAEKLEDLLAALKIKNG